MKLRYSISALILGSAMAVVAAWWLSGGDSNRFMMISGVAYSGLIFIFLGVLLWAFVWAHVEYQDTIEDPKFMPLELEREEDKRHPKEVRT